MREDWFQTKNPRLTLAQRIIYKRSLSKEDVQDTKSLKDLDIQKKRLYKPLYNKVSKTNLKKFTTKKAKQKKKVSNKKVFF